VSGDVVQHKQMNAQRTRKVADFRTSDIDQQIAGQCGAGPDAGEYEAKEGETAEKLILGVQTVSDINNN